MNVNPQATKTAIIGLNPSANKIIIPHFLPKTLVELVAPALCE